MTSADILDSGTPPRSRALRDWPGPAGAPVVAVLAVTIALLLTTGVTAVVRLSGGGLQPEQVLPGSTFAFAKLDLDPAASQKLAVRALAGRFDDAPGDSLVDLRDAVARELVEPLGLDYDDDVEPWIGDRYAVAGFVVGDEAHPLAAIQVEDEEQARRAIAKARARDDGPLAEVAGIEVSAGPGAGVAFLRGYALLAESQELADEAVRQATASAIADDRDYVADVARLTGDQIVTGWADNEQVYDRFFADVVTAMEMDAAAHDPRASLRGRSVFGIHATRRHVEVESLVLGAEPPVDGTGAALLAALPRDTTAAVVVHNPAAVRSHTAAIGAFGSLGGAGLLALGFGFGGFGFDDSASLGGPDPDPDPYTAIVDALAPSAEVLETQLLPLLQGATALALGPLPGGVSSRSDASLLLVAEVAGPGNARVPLLHARDAARRAGLTAEVAIRGRLVHGAIGSAYVDGVGEPGDLGESELFRDAMGSLDPHTTTAAFVDLTAIARTQPDFPDDLEPVQAIGMSSYPRPGGSGVRLRIVIG